VNNMEKISSYIIGTNLDSLTEGFKQGRVPEDLQDPLQSLLPHITRAVADHPTSIYLFSNDENAGIRNYFGYALANALQQHVPSALLVDCAFLDVGMDGIVPQKDALGFLDLLLYGSSLGVITQETNGGVRVVSAGSFPVTKKMPFVLNSFQDASRRLVSHSHCAIYTGPLLDDEGELHPLIGAVDIPILIRATGAATANTLDPIEEQIAAQWDKELISVRVTPAAQPAAAAAEEPPPVLDEKPSIAPKEPLPEDLEPSLEESRTAGGPEFEEIETPEMPPPPEAPPAPEEPAPFPTRQPPTVDLGEEMLVPHRDKRYTSLVPKIATIAIALIAVLFLVWWFNTERGEIGETGRTGEPEGMRPQETAERTTPGAETEAGPESEGTAVDTVVSGQLETAAAPPEIGEQQTAGETTAEISPPARVEEEDTVKTTRRLIDPRDILVMDDLKNNWSDWYFIHISSFRESTKARTEVANLEKLGFPVFIVFLNIRDKGSWYRVYAGPLKTREEARNMKKLLDDSPGVRFTRITRI
jgi:cell division septation protein DedD